MEIPWRLSEKCAIKFRSRSRYFLRNLFAKAPGSYESALNSKMASSEEIGIALVAVILNELHEEDNQRKTRRARKRRFWIRDINQRQREQGDFTNLVQELRNDEEQFFVYFRMNRNTFDRLFGLVGPFLRRLQTRHSQLLLLE